MYTTTPTAKTTATIPVAFDNFPVGTSAQFQSVSTVGGPTSPADQTLFQITSSHYFRYVSPLRAGNYVLHYIVYYPNPKVPVTWDIPVTVAP